MNNWDIKNWVTNMAKAVTLLIKKFPIDWETIQNKPDLELDISTGAFQSLKMKSPNGTVYKITIDNDGNLKMEVIA